MEKKSLFLSLSEEHLMNITGGADRTKYLWVLIDAIKEWLG